MVNLNFINQKQALKKSLSQQTTSDAKQEEKNGIDSEKVFDTLKSEAVETVVLRHEKGEAVKVAKEKTNDPGLAQLELELAQLREEREQQKQSFIEVSTQLNALQVDLTEQGSENEELLHTNADLEQELAQLKIENQDLHGNLANIKKNIVEKDEISLTVEQLQSQVDTLASEKEELTETVKKINETKQQEISAVEENANAQLSELEKQLDLLAESTKILEQKLANEEKENKIEYYEELLVKHNADKDFTTVEKQLKAALSEKEQLLVDQKAEFQKQLSDVQEEKNLLDTNLNNLKEEKESLVEQVNSTQFQHNENARNLQTLTNDKHKLTKQLSEKDAELTKLAQKLTELEKTNDEKITILHNEWQEKVAKLEADKSSAIETLQTNLGEQLVQARDETTKLMAQLNDGAKGKEQVLVDLTEEITDVRGRLHNLQIVHESKIRDFDVVESKVSELTEQVASLTDQNNYLKKQLSTSEGQLSGIQSHQQVSEATVATLKEEKEQLEKELKASLEQQQELIEDKESGIAEAEAVANDNIQIAERKYQAIEIENQQLAEKLAETEDLRNQLVDDLNIENDKKVQAAVASVRNELQVAQEKIAELTSENEKINVLQEQLRIVEVKNNELEEKVQEFSEVVSKDLDTETDSIELQQLTEQLESAVLEKQQLEEELAETKEQLLDIQADPLASLLQNVDNDDLSEQVHEELLAIQNEHAQIDEEKQVLRQQRKELRELYEEKERNLQQKIRSENELQRAERTQIDRELDHYIEEANLNKRHNRLIGMGVVIFALITFIYAISSSNSYIVIGGSFIATLIGAYLLVTSFVEGSPVEHWNNPDKDETINVLDSENEPRVSAASRTVQPVSDMKTDEEEDEDWEEIDEYVLEDEEDLSEDDLIDAEDFADYDDEEETDEDDLLESGFAEADAILSEDEDELEDDDWDETDEELIVLDDEDDSDELSDDDFAEADEILSESEDDEESFEDIIIEDEDEIADFDDESGKTNDFIIESESDFDEDKDFESLESEDDIEEDTDTTK